jgi:protein-tyrosine-phosphatase
MQQTNPLQVPEFLKLIAHDLRWQLVKALVSSDRQVNELVELLNEKMNLVSYHLKKLRDEELVITRRSEADARDIYYSLDLGRLRTMYFEAGSMLHPALNQASSPQTDHHSEELHRILFVCSHNAARSQMAEGLLRHYAGAQLAVYSAGSQVTRVHPDAISTMAAMGIDISHHSSKSLQEFQGQSFDYVITVCDNARESCPDFEGQGQKIHWGFPDPLQIQDESERRQAFQDIALRLDTRIKYFLQSL